MVRLNRGLMSFRGNGFGGQGKKGGEPASNGARYAEYGTHDFDKFYINDYIVRFYNRVNDVKNGYPGYAG